MKRLSLAIIVALVSLLLPMVVQASQMNPPAPQSVQQGASLTATVTVAKLNVRRAPRVTSSRIGRLYLGNRVTLVGRTADNNWVQIVFGERYGWLAYAYVLIEGDNDVRDLPIAQVIPPFLTVTALPSVNVRMGPSELYPVVTNLPASLEVDVIAYQRRPLWFQVAMPAEGPIGWVRGDTVTVTGPTSVLPQASGQPMAQIISYRVHVRSEPSLAAAVIGNVRLDELYPVIGLDARRNWWLISTDFGDGWVLSAFVKVFGNISDLPEQDTEPLGGGGAAAAD
jgi:uncharacterized protein YgiM (DUF1202 family)